MSKINIDKQILTEIISNLTFDFPYGIDDYINNLYMENYHYHSSFSNTTIADSPSSNEDYAKQIIEYKSKCIFSGEHGNQGNQFEVYELSEKYNLKYCHSAEAYWVKDRHEKDKTNCHICLIATNAEGREDLNYILSIANEYGFYSRPRIDLELLLSVNPNNLIVTSACVAGWLYEDADDIWIKIAEHFGNNFFLEIQSHNTDKQKELNKHILELSEKYNLQIICGLDSHYIDEDIDDIKRNQILIYKKINYPDEEGWYLDYPDSWTIYERLKKQGVLSNKQILTAIINTNVFIPKCEQIIFDRTFKIPCVYPNTTYEERVKIFHDILNKEYRKEKDKNAERIKGIRYEAEQITESGVVDYFLTNNKILKEAIENEGGILTTTSRGSMASFYVNKLLGFTTVDRFNSEIPIYPERFLTKERVQAGQMPDVDMNVAEQEPFVRASRNIIGEHSCYPLMAIEKLKEKSAWQLYAGANGVDPQTANAISKYIDAYNDKLKYADEEDKDFILVEDFIPKEYIDLYKQSVSYQSIVINLKVHACGFLLLEGDIRRKIGLINAVSETTGKRTLCACIEGNYLDSFGFVKNDFLIVDVVGLIKECFDSINEPVPTFDELRTMIKDDKLTWDIYKKGITMCVNQVEKDSTSKKAQKYQPTNLAELSSFIAGIRPGFASLLPTFIARQKYSTGEEKIDEILKDSSNFMIFQESLMKVLSFLGQPMGETYGVIKAISKKKLKGEKKDKLEKSLKENWKNILGNLDNFENVWTVIESSARYAFNAPHALSMAGDSAYVAWFKSHHTSKFYEVVINHYNLKNKKDKIDALTKEAIEFYGYKIAPYKFRSDNRKVTVDDETKTIYPNMSNIKDMQKIAPQILYDMKDEKAEDWIELLKLIKKTELNKKSLDILIKLNYFSSMGEINQLLQEIEIFKKFNSCKVLAKDKLSEIEYECVMQCAQKETPKQFRDIDSTQLINLLISQATIPQTTLYDHIHYELILLGYTNLTADNISLDIYAVEAIEINQWGTPWITLYNIYCGKSKTVKIDKTFYKSNPISKGDIIKCSFKDKDKCIKAGTDEKGKVIWQKTGETEQVLKLYSKQKEWED